MKIESHQVKVDEERKTLSIHRVMSDGTVELLTSTDLPNISAHESWDEFEDFAKQLGENLLMDSPSARRVLKL
jgi:hypothetical protein